MSIIQKNSKPCFSIDIPSQVRIDSENGGIETNSKYQATITRCIPVSILCSDDLDVEWQKSMPGSISNPSSIVLLEEAVKTGKIGLSTIIEGSKLLKNLTPKQKQQLEKNIEELKKSKKPHYAIILLERLHGALNQKLSEISSLVGELKEALNQKLEELGKTKDRIEGPSLFKNFLDRLSKEINLALDHISKETKEVSIELIDKTNEIVSKYLNKKTSI